jgi:hypothetical protein
MSRIVLDAALRAKLNGLNEQVEIYDEAGSRVGCFLPEEVYRQLLRDWASRHLVDDEEVERRLQQPGGHTLAEIWQTLGAR